MVLVVSGRWLVVRATDRVGEIGERTHARQELCRTKFRAKCGLAPDSHKDGLWCCSDVTKGGRVRTGKNRGCGDVPHCRMSAACTKFGQAPVDELHSIENKRNGVARISLTSSAGGVKHTRSLTTFWFFEAGGKLIPTRQRWNYRPSRDLKRESEQTPTATASIRGSESQAAGGRSWSESKARWNPETSSGHAADCESGNSLSSETVRKYQTRAWARIATRQRKVNRSVRSRDFFFATWPGR